jgi:putative PIN family toxin of toxin-antitoxin system
LDTNVLISAYLGHGKPRRLLLRLLKRHEVIASPQLLAELADVLSREGFQETEDWHVGTFLSIIARNAAVVTPRRSFKVIADDPDDDMVLNAAHEGRASHIVTGDRHLLALGRFRGIRVVTVDKMLELIR